jgi:hypothetical protein
MVESVLKKDFFLNRTKRLAFGVALLAGFFVCFGIPGYQILENNAYRKAYKQTLDYVKFAAEKNEQKLIWVPPGFSMSIIDMPNARLYVPALEHLSGLNQVIDTNSIYLVPYRSDANTIRKFQPARNDSIIVRQLAQPVKGLLRFDLKRSRTDSLGLWMVTAITK